VTYLKNILLSALAGIVANILLVVLMKASALTDTSFAKFFALISAVLMAAVLVISRRAQDRSNG
jgi:general stress protein CsbA